MNTERESLLSAHLDGQLSPDERRSVETTVATDPAAAEALRSLAGVRDLVAGLSRPTGPDLSPEIMKRIEARSLKRGASRPTIRPLRLAALFGGVAASLACLALWSESERLPPPRHPIPRIAPAAPEPVLADSSATADASIQPTVAELVGPPAPARTEDSANGEPITVVASTTPPSEDSPAADSARSLVHDLLDGPEPPQNFLVTDQPGGEAAVERVAALLALSTHRDFHRIELPRAETEDGAGATEAVVFAATLDRDELATFQERLAAGFPERFQESVEKPAGAAELAANGRISTLAANPAGDVRIPQANLALRFQPREQRNWPANPEENDRTTKGEPAKPSEKADAALAKSNQPRSILVWIIKPPVD